MQQKPQGTESQGPLPDERRLAILAQLEGRGRVVSSDLARRWEISEDTIRRDIRELDDAGLLRKVHGGALPRSPQIGPYQKRAESNVAEKVRLAEHGARAIVDGMTVLLYGGTTVLEAARRLRPDLRARIVTNDPRIALEACSRAAVETILLGGRVLTGSQLVVGAQAIDDVRALRADLALIGGCALHDESGLGVGEYDEAALQRAFLAAANVVVALVTTDKLQTVAPFRVASAAAIDRLVTSIDADSGVLARYRDLGLTVECV